MTILSASSRRFLKRTVEAKSQVSSSPGSSGASATGALAGNDTSRIRVDFEGLLELAENLQQSLNKHSDAYGKSFIGSQASALLIFIECMTILLGSGRHVSSWNAVLHSINPAHANALTAGSVLLLFLTLHYAFQLWHHALRMKYAERVDKRGLTEVVELLREIEPVVAREEGFSALERVQIRIRLSRFGVGSSSRQDTGAVSRTLTEDVRARKSRADQELAKPLR